MVLKRVFAILCLFLSLDVASGEEISIEELIQRNVVDACDKINKPKQTCDLEKAVTPVKVTPPEVQAQNLNRCNREREDVPTSLEAQSYSGKNFPVSQLSESDAQDVFKYVNKQKSRYVLNEDWAAATVCAARSHLIAADILQDCKVNSGKVFVRPSRSAASLWIGRGSLFVEAKGKKYRWDSFHVANLIYVEKNGKSEPYIIDPILFNKAVPLAEWEGLVKMNDSSAESWTTSSSAFGQSDRHEDDPANGLYAAPAEDVIRKARTQARIMRGQ